MARAKSQLALQFVTPVPYRGKSTVRVQNEVEFERGRAPKNNIFTPITYRPSSDCKGSFNQLINELTKSAHKLEVTVKK